MKKRLIFYFCFLLRSIFSTDDNCQPVSCVPNEPIIRFPFRLVSHQPSSCGFPGFDLSCNKQNQTIIQLPSSRSYTVNRINYLSQVIYIDPNFCGRNGINTLNLTDTPFDFSDFRRYTFYNCSLQNYGFMYPSEPFPCVSDRSVIAVQTRFVAPGSMPTNCKLMKTIDVPVRWDGDIRSELELMWFTPSCRRCEMEGKGCGLVNEYGQTGCLDSSNDFPTSAKYGLILGLGVLISIALIGLICYMASGERDYNGNQNQSDEILSIVVIPKPLSRTGLDRSIIESYPKTTLGESCRLPSDDITCAICLSDYKAKDSLRTIPECNHYFHVDCIDEWLKLNGTCPVCRISPVNSSLVTPCSLMSMTSVGSS